jgi:hypothetical protein
MPQVLQQDVSLSPRQWLKDSTGDRAAIHIEDDDPRPHVDWM